MPKRSKATGRQVNFTHPDKIYFPGTGTTKGEIIRYYLEVAPWLLPHLEDRPVTLIRFPNGYGGESFYEKNAPAHAPEWIQTFRVPRRRHEGEINYILINDAETLAWCENLGAIELHPFLHRVPDIERPTHIAFDLDPGEGADLLTCAKVGFLLRDVLAGLGLKAWPKVTGSKGLQLYVPLNTKVAYELTSPFAKSVAELLEQQHPELVVSNMSKALRKGRVLIDWSQNSQSKTTVAVYAVRAKRDRPYVSMPVEWDELKRAIKKKDINALFFSPEDAVERLRKQGDLFAPVLTVKQSLPKAFEHAVSAKRPASAPEPRPTKKTPSSLREYARKRDFSRTAEPPPAAAGKGGHDASRFVIQKHAASHLHYDFRLEMHGTLKSWAVPKGLPTELKVRRSAFETEDHPLDYLDFEGTIPAGQYGGGTVMVWDIGTFELLSGNHSKGSLRVRLHGRKLKGDWQLYRIREEDGKNVWLLEKREQEHRPISPKQDDTSVLSRRSMARIAADNDNEWQSNREASSAARSRPQSRSTRKTKSTKSTAATQQRAPAKRAAKRRSSIKKKSRAKARV